MEKFAPLRVLAGLCLALAVAACANEGPNPRAANIAPPPPPPNPLQAQAPQQAPPQQQMVQPQQMSPQQQQPQPRSAQQAQPRGGANAGSMAGLVMGGHLVSYKSMEAAEAGWQALVRKQPALQQLRPYFVPVLVRGEPWVRLVAGDFPDRDEVNRFCNWARAQQLYCAPMPLAGASLENPSSIVSGGGAASGGAPAAAASQRQRQPRPASPPQSGLNDALPVPAPAAPPTPVAAAPALVAPAPNANNVPAQPLAPPLPPRRQPGNPSLPQ